MDDTDIYEARHGHQPNETWESDRPQADQYWTERRRELGLST